jgi:hypothetical protein
MRSRLRALRRYGRRWTWRAEIGEVWDQDERRRCIRVRVWGSGKNGRALQVDLVSMTPPGRWAAPADDDDAYPTAEDVHRLIDHGLSRGWDPDARGGTTHAPASDPTVPVIAGFRIAGPEPQPDSAAG